MRSDFLVHWTGRDIHTDPASLSDVQRSAYADRLRDILKEGLWMTKPEEHIEGNNKAWIKYDIPLTCFTEIRLSQAQSHSRRYGLMGIGVKRQFVLDRLGGPVHYVRNHASECVIGNVQIILAELKAMRPERPDLVEYLGINTSFIKSMSDAQKDNFTYLDEHEWRIVHTHAQEKCGRLVRPTKPLPELRIPLQLDDVRFVVLPDEQTREKVIADGMLATWFHTPASFGAVRPILLTLEECAQF